jgi:hypothetical protein
MVDQSKRQTLKYAGASLTALSLGIGGKVASDGNTSVVEAAADDVASTASRSSRRSQKLDYERMDNGDIEFDYQDVTFESQDGEIELRDVGIDFETEDRREFDLMVDTSSATLDLEVKDSDEIELRLDTGSNAVDFEVDGGGRTYHKSGGDVEFEAARSPERAFEAETGDVEYRTDSIDFDWDNDNADLDIRGDINLEVNLEEGIDLEYDDDSISLEFDRNGSPDLEYTGEEVDLEWENGREDDFEAREAGSLL